MGAHEVRFLIPKLSSQVKAPDAEWRIEFRAFRLSDAHSTWGPSLTGTTFPVLTHKQRRPYIATTMTYLDPTQHIWAVWMTSCIVRAHCTHCRKQRHATQKQVASYAVCQELAFDTSRHANLRLWFRRAVRPGGAGHVSGTLVGPTSIPEQIVVGLVGLIAVLHPTCSCHSSLRHSYVGDNQACFA